VSLDRSGPPTAGTVRSFHFPPFRRLQLDNGTTVVLARMPRLPLIRLDLLATAGAQFEPPDSSGLATFTAGLLDEGTRRFSATEIARQMEQLGGSLTCSAGWNVASTSISLLAEHLEKGLELLCEVTLEPTFPISEIDRLRQQRLADLMQQRNETRYLADRYFVRMIYGEGIYGRPLNGTPQSLEALSREKIEAFYQQCYGPAGRTLMAVGDLDTDTLLAAIEARLGAATGQPSPVQPTLTGRDLAGIEVHIVDRPGAAQTELRVGHIGVPRRHPDYTSLEVMNAILGGKFTSRINLNLRERRGYTYGVHSRYHGRLGPGPFQIATAVGTEVAGAASSEILMELRRIREAPVTREELDDTRSYLHGIFVNHLQTIDDLTSRLSTLSIYDLPDDYFESYLQEVEATTQDEVLRVAQEHLHPDHLVLIAVGPAADLVPQLEPLGTVQVWDPSEDEGL
jgi:zinc protease